MELPCPGSIRRKTLSLTPGGLVTVESQKEGQLPLLIRPSVESVDLATWAVSNREFIKTHLLKHGGILFRNFRVSSPEIFGQLIIACSAEPLQYA